MLAKIAAATTKAVTTMIFSSPVPGVYVWPRPNLFIGGLRLEKLSLITTFTSSQLPEPSVPTFERTGRPERRMWAPPEGTRLFIIFSGTPESSDRPDSSALLKFIGLSLVDNKRAWMLPLPNQYEDGRFCIGNRVEVYGPPDVFAHRAYNAICETRYNRDLLRDDTLRNAQTLFAWKDGKQTVVADWQPLCLPYSNLAFNGLLEHLIAADTSACYAWNPKAFDVDEPIEDEEEDA